jgi:hypothetical protein
MNLQTIAVLTRLPVRKIRYVLDHRLLPGLRVAGQRNVVGQARILTDLEGFSVACAAILLESGVRKDAVISFMAGLSQFPVPSKSRGNSLVFAIQRAFEPAVTPAEAVLADGTNLRFRLGREDTGWLQPGTYAPLSEEYVPRVAVSIDLARVRKLFPGRR